MSHELQEQHSFVLDENQSLREEVEALKAKVKWLEDERASEAQLEKIFGPDYKEKAAEFSESENARLLREVQRLTRIGERITELEEENLNLREMRLQDAQALARMQDHLAHLEGFTS